MFKISKQNLVGYSALHSYPAHFEPLSQFIPINIDPTNEFYYTDQSNNSNQLVHSYSTSSGQSKSHITNQKHSKFNSKCKDQRFGMGAYKSKKFILPNNTMEPKTSYVQYNVTTNETMYNKSCENKHTTNNFQTMPAAYTKTVNQINPWTEKYEDLEFQNDLYENKPNKLAHMADAYAENSFV